MSMSDKAIRKQMRKLGGKPTVGSVERAKHSINASEAEKRFRKEQARERGIENVPIDPASVSDPRRWYEGRPIDTRDPAIERMKQERARAQGDRFR